MRTIDDLITDSPTFAGLEPAQLEFIAGCARNEHVEAGTMLMREGEPAERFWLIRRGVVALELYVPGPRAARDRNARDPATWWAGRGCSLRTVGRWTGGRRGSAT